MGKIYSKFKQLLLSNRYVNRWVILLMDLGLSVLATGTACLILWKIIDFSFLETGFWRLFTVTLCASLIPFLCCRTYNNIIRHSSLKSIWVISLAALLKMAIMLLVFSFFPSYRGNVPEDALILGAVLDFLMTTVFLVGIRVLMLIGYDLAIARVGGQTQKKVFVYGFSDKSVSLRLRLLKSPHYKIIGFITHDEIDKNFKVSDYPTYYFKDRAELEKILRKHPVDGILFSTDADARLEGERLVKYCESVKIKIYIAPSVDELGDDEASFSSKIRPVKIEDLLGRDEIFINRDEVLANVYGKVVMVTGGAGSIGSELCRQLATLGVKQLIIFDNAETPLHNIRLEIEHKFPGFDFVPFIGDVRVPERIETAFARYSPQIVFHAAAYKHVPLMEENPCEAVFANVLGTRNLADACVRHGVEKMVMVSTDKAVNPTNVMGCSKRLAEIYCQSLGLAIEEGRHEGTTKFVTTRFGNVLGSNGSVIPLFRQQIAAGGPVTVTDPRINRFFMTIPEACRLVLEAASMSTGSQIFVFEMGEPVKIVDLARRMISLSGFEPDKDIKIVFTGLRPGEKLYEEVLSNAENTVPTDHKKILIAKVREYDYTEVNDAFKVFDTLARSGDKMATVRAMKSLVPEFKSNNSEFEVLDREITGTGGGIALIHRKLNRDKVS